MKLDSPELLKEFLAEQNQDSVDFKTLGLGFAIKTKSLSWNNLGFCV
ncbi:MAG: hypothetical protein MUE85_11550 [Microscillaceae bacterium]|jgi:hypothetical protein|nr:hypothetical protein [Microscillaceae bacterium]